MKNLLILLSLLLLSSPLFSQSKEKPCYISVNSSDEFNQTLLSNISISIISQYFKEIKPFPPSGLGGSDNCIYDVTVSSEGGRTFVTLQGKDMNSFGDSNFVGIDGFQQSLLKSLYRSLSDKRKLICEGYGEYLEECGGGSSLKDRGVEEKKCYLTLESNNKKNIKLYTNISVSIVSQYVTKVEKDDPLIKRPLGKSDSCIYEIVIEQTEDTLFTTVTGEGLNSYGDSKLKGIEGFQQSLLKSLFRSLRDKRGMICDDYRDLLEECKDVVVEEKVTIQKVEPVVDKSYTSNTLKVNSSYLRKIDIQNHFKLYWLYLDNWEINNIKQTRDNNKVKIALNSITDACSNKTNLLPLIINAALEYATLGEIVDSMKEVFGEWTEKSSI